MKNRKYIEIFAREAEELLQKLRQGVLDLEQSGFSVAGVHELLRHAHTLKGSARMLDLETLGQVAHRTEDLLKDLEGGSRSFDSTTADLLLLATDALEALIAQAHAGGGIAVDVAAVLESLETGRLPEEPEAPAPAVEKGAPAPAAKVERKERETVRASVERLDQLVNLLGELLLTRRLLGERGRQLHGLQRRIEGFMRRLRRAENYRLMKEIHHELSSLSSELERDLVNFNYLAEDLHHQAMELRMLPLATISDDLTRMARDLAREQGKELRLTVRGEDVELDRMMLEAVRPMLLHLLRNAVDHGIEEPEERFRTGKQQTGQVELSARYEGGLVRIELSDDGRGIDPSRVREVAIRKKLLDEREAENLSDDEAVYLILRPGFSTREFITDVSGRGVGMDVVKENLDRVKGNLIISSTPGEGTSMVLTLPLTLALVTGLIFDCEEERFAIPLHYVTEVLRLSEEDILTEGGREVVRVRGTTLPLLALREILELPRKQLIDRGGRVTALVLKHRGQQLACLVTRSHGTQELVAKTMGRQLRSVRFFSGATILGDGIPALILSVPDLFAAGLAGESTRLRQEFEARRSQARKGHVMVVDDSITTRIMEKNILETHGYEVTVAVSGEDALAKLADHSFDLIVSDVEMPGITGFELTRRLRQREETRETPVIIVTSLASDQDRRKGIEVGAQAYIVKGSFDQGTLLKTVETLIG